MRLKLFLTAVVAVGAAYFAAALWSPANAMGPVGSQAAASKAELSLVEKIHRRRWYRGYAYYPRPRWYGYRYRPYYYSYYEPYYYAPRRYYDGPYYPYYRSYYRPRVYGYGYYGPRFGLSIGF
jgi:hypothetical protein